MSTVTIPSLPSIPAGYVNGECRECAAAMFVRPTAIFPTCLRCARGAAEREARRLVSDVRHLIAGTDTFALLTADERREPLRQLGYAGEPARNAADAPDPATREELEQVAACRDAEEQEDAERWDEQWNGGTL